MKSIEKLLTNNQNWARHCVSDDPDYFQKLVGLQTPQFLWIGCSDARVPANTIIGLNPGEVFVHRNVANQIPPQDLNCLSVIQFAVEFLKIQDIIVCGHYGCGGIQNACAGKPLGLIDAWLAPIKALAARHADELASFSGTEERLRRLCELNIKQQVLNLCATESVQKAWASGQPLTIHGLIYDLHDGLLKNLDLCVTSDQDANALDKR